MLNQPFVQKGFTGMGFEIRLEFKGFSFVVEGTVPFEAPGTVFACMGAAATIMVTKTGFIGG